jgi:hypothetical protein
MCWKRLALGVLTALVMMAATYVLPRGGVLRDNFFGAVSHDGRGMGDFRVALRETEILRCSAFRVPRIAFAIG